jgi:hypothetical protein
LKVDAMGRLLVYGATSPGADNDLVVMRLASCDPTLPDAGMSDAGFIDAGTPTDAGSPDAGTPIDAGLDDAGVEMARSYAVGCSCQGGSSELALGAIALMAWFLMHRSRSKRA